MLDICVPIHELYAKLWAYGLFFVIVKWILETYRVRNQELFLLIEQKKTYSSVKENRKGVEFSTEVQFILGNWSDSCHVVLSVSYYSYLRHSRRFKNPFHKLYYLVFLSFFVWLLDIFTFFPKSSPDTSRYVCYWRKIQWSFHIDHFYSVGPNLEAQSISLIFFHVSNHAFLHSVCFLWPCLFLKILHTLAARSNILFPVESIFGLF